MQNSRRGLISLVGLFPRLPAAFSGFTEAEVHQLPLAASCAASAAGAESFGRNAASAFCRRYLHHLMSRSEALGITPDPHKQVWCMLASFSWSFEPKAAPWPATCAAHVLIYRRQLQHSCAAAVDVVGLATRAMSSTGCITIQ